ncbi:MAG: carboxypeptidase-like regulatory domain-containing protein [Planctomycetaceae bacterium]
MRLWLAGVLVACSLGCGGSSDADPNLREVSGTVTANGKPLSNGTVALVSEDGKQAFTGMIGPDGDYEIKASGSAEGALPGQYRVGVQSWSTPPGMADDGKPIEGVLAFDKKFADPPPPESRSPSRTAADPMTST